MTKITRTSLLLLALLVHGTGAAHAQEPQPNQEPDIAELDIEQLGSIDVVVPSLDVEVTTVSRSESTVGKSPAAIFVITNEMIRRSAARSIPEVLRMAPGVNVARMSGNKWAISIRGFNGRFANKLLVQIDGRSVYTPLFSGVYWDVQNVVLEDVDRIEIIRGPGATVWGDNAVNGIINIITKNSRDTQGGYFDMGAGDMFDSFATARVGGAVSNDLTYRIYGTWSDRDAAPAAPGFGTNIAGDRTRIAQGGFRMDYTPDHCNEVTFSGDYYSGLSGGRTSLPGVGIFNADSSENVRGANLLYRWTHKISDDSDWSLQAYYDHTERRANANFIGNDRDTIDVDFQHRFQLNQNNEVIWGFGYRNSDDFIHNPSTGFPFSFSANVLPNDVDLDWFNYFVQDRLTLIEDRWYFYLGSKFSHNEYTGFEIQPTARFLWTPTERYTAWASVSRAVRTPSRADIGIFFQGFTGNPNFVSEDTLSYELGMRGQPTDKFFWDLAMFYNDYTDVRDDAGAMFTNRPTHEQTWGFELATSYQANECWNLRAAYSFLRGTNVLDDDILLSPRNQVYVNSTRDLGYNLQFDTILRYVDLLPGTGVALGPATAPSYLVADLRLAWQPTKHFEWYLVGRNLLDNDHNEFAADVIGAINSEVTREVYSGISLRY